MKVKETTKDLTAAEIGKLREELAACERVLARVGPEECRVTTRIENLQKDRARTVGGHTYEGDLHPSARAILAAIDKELPTLKKRLSEIETPVKVAYKRSIEIRGILMAGICQPVELAVEKAASEVPSRVGYSLETQKLQELHGRLAEAEGNLEKARKVKEAIVEREARAAALVKSGTIPQAGMATTTEEIVRASEEVEIFRQAIEIQKRVVIELRADFIGEIQAALTPTYTTLVKRTATGYQDAVDATVASHALQEAVRRITGGCGIVNFAFYGVRPPSPGEDYEFGSWLSQMRKDGIEV